MDSVWHNVCVSTSLGEGKPHRVQIGALDVLLVRIGGVPHAVSNLCTHADAYLHEGRLRGHRLICPLHGASFDARTGAVLAKPATQPLRCYELREEDGAILIRLPAVAA